MFPIADDNPRLETPVVTWSIIAVCVLVFFWQLSLGTTGGEIAVYEYGMIPARLFGAAQLQPELVAVPAWATAAIWPSISYAASPRRSPKRSSIPIRRFP